MKRPRKFWRWYKSGLSGTLDDSDGYDVIENNRADRESGGQIEVSTTLTKNLLMTLPAGALVQSYIAASGSYFSVKTVENVFKRYGQWEEIRKAGVNGRRCRVTVSKDYADRAWGDKVTTHVWRELNPPTGYNFEV